jgi:hypothetical protein
MSPRLMGRLEEYMSMIYGPKPAVQALAHQ